MNKQLVSSDNPVLHNPTNKIDLNNEIELIKELSKIMHVEQGIGIAAPQIGESKNLFLVLDLDTDEVKVFANVKILGISKETNFLKEGCLSFPGIQLTIERPKAVLVEYETINWQGQLEHKRDIFDGLNARVIQHEFDHIMGITFDMRVND